MWKSGHSDISNPSGGVDDGCSSEEMFAPDCYDQNRRSDFQGCVEDNRYPYRDIYAAMMRY